MNDFLDCGPGQAHRSDKEEEKKCAQKSNEIPFCEQQLDDSLYSFMLLLLIMPIKSYKQGK